LLIFIIIICAFAENDYLLETVNELIYTPKSERDFGTLACWGRNSIGKQSEPCLFQIVPAGNYSFFFLYSDCSFLLSMNEVNIVNC
jgi:hypothetical protein